MYTNPSFNDNFQTQKMYSIHVINIITMIHPIDLPYDKVRHTINVNSCYLIVIINTLLVLTEGLYITILVLYYFYTYTFFSIGSVELIFALQLLNSRKKKDIFTYAICFMSLYKNIPNDVRQAYAYLID